MKQKPIRYYVSEKKPGTTLENERWWVNGPDIEEMPKFATSDEGRDYLLLQGIPADQIVIEKW